MIVYRIQREKCIEDTLLGIGSITIQEVNIDDLPEDQDSKSPTITTQIIDDDFINYNEAAILKVTSSIVPKEFNYLINSYHNDSTNIKVVNAYEISFDSRFKQDK